MTNYAPSRIRMLLGWRTASQCQPVDRLGVEADFTYLFSTLISSLVKIQLVYLCLSSLKLYLVDLVST